MYEKFPVPLINRLEKHYLGMETMLTEGERGYGGVRSTISAWRPCSQKVNLDPDFKFGSGL